MLRVDLYKALPLTHHKKLQKVKQLPPTSATAVALMPFHASTAVRIFPPYNCSWKMGEGPGGWDQAGATRMLFLHVAQFYSVGGPTGQHVLLSLTWKREKRFIVKVLADSYSLHKHYDHSLSITWVYRSFPLWWCRVERQTFCIVKSYKWYYLFIRLQAILSHSSIIALRWAFDCWP